MAWNELLFEEAVRNKMAVQRQNAESDTMRANAAAQDVNQRPEIQARADAAAMDRAQVGAQTQLSTVDMTNQAQAARAAAANTMQRDIAALQDRGALERAQLTTGTQRDIASQSLAFDREKLAQQGTQFGQTLALDTAKAQDLSEREWGILGRPEYGNPTMNLHTGTMESTLKRPAIARAGRSALDELTGRQSASLSPAPSQPQASSSAAKATPVASALAGMSDGQLYNLQGQARRAAASPINSAPAPAAASGLDNPRSGLFEAPARASLNGALDSDGKPTPNNRFNFDYAAGVGGDLPAGRPLNFNLSVPSPAESVRKMAAMRARLGKE